MFCECVSRLHQSSLVIVIVMSHWFFWAATRWGVVVLYSFFFSQRFADSSLSVDHSHTHTNQTLVNENLNLSPNIKQMPRRGIQEITSGTKDVLYFGSGVFEVQQLPTRLEKKMSFA